MPWNPSETNQIPQILMQTGSTIGSAIGGGISKWQAEEERKKKELEQLEQKQYIADAIMSDAAQRNLVSKQELIDYRSAPQRKQVDMAFGIQAQSQFAAAAEQQRQAKEMFAAKLAEMKASTDNANKQFAPPPEVLARLQSKGIEAAPASRSNYNFFDTNRYPQGSTNSTNYKDMSDLSNDLMKESGLALSDWINSPNMRVDSEGKPSKTGEYVAPATVWDDPKKGRTMEPNAEKKLPFDRFNAYLQQYQRLAGSGTPPPAATVGGVVSVNTPQEAAALPPGTRYRGPDGKLRIR